MKLYRENQNTHFMFNNFCFRKSEILFPILYSRTGHRWQYCACALHAGKLRLQTHVQNM